MTIRILKASNLFLYILLLVSWGGVLLLSRVINSSTTQRDVLKDPSSYNNWWRELLTIALKSILRLHKMYILSGEMRYLLLVGSSALNSMELAITCIPNTPHTLHAVTHQQFFCSGNWKT